MSFFKKQSSELWSLLLAVVLLVGTLGYLYGGMLMSQPIAVSPEGTVTEFAPAVTAVPGVITAQKGNELTVLLSPGGSGKAISKTVLFSDTMHIEKEVAVKDTDQYEKESDLFVKSLAKLSKAGGPIQVPSVYTVSNGNINDLTPGAHIVVFSSADTKERNSFIANKIRITYEPSKEISVTPDQQGSDFSIFSSLKSLFGVKEVSAASITLSASDTTPSEGDAITMSWTGSGLSSGTTCAFAAVGPTTKTEFSYLVSGNEPDISTEYPVPAGGEIDGSLTFYPVITANYRMTCSWYGFPLYNSNTVAVTVTPTPSQEGILYWDGDANGTNGGSRVVHNFWCDAGYDLRGYEYTCSCTNNNIWYACVKPNQASVTLTATPTSVIAGNSSVLTWVSSDTTSCTSSDFATANATNNTSPGVTVTPAATKVYTITCAGPNGTQAQDTATVTVTSGASSDLVAVDPAGGSNGPTVNGLPGGPFTFSGAIKNISATNLLGSTQFVNRFQFDLDNNNVWDTGSINIAYVVASTTAPINSGAFIATTTAQWKNPVAGTHKVRLCADYDGSAAGKITESNEGNNCGASTTFTVTGPSASISANPVAADFGSSTMLTWSSAGGATRCVKSQSSGSGFMSGTAASGSQAGTNLTASSVTFGVSCDTGVGTVAAVAQVVVPIIKYPNVYTLNGSLSKSSAAISCQGAVPNSVTFTATSANAGQLQINQQYPNMLALDIGNDGVGPYTLPDGITQYDMAIQGTPITSLPQGTSGPSSQKSYTAIFTPDGGMPGVSNSTIKAYMCPDNANGVLVEKDNAGLSGELRNCGSPTPLSTTFTVGSCPVTAITATCVLSPTLIREGGTATWSVTNVQGGYGAGTYSYSWSGSDGLTGTTASLPWSYPTLGTKTAQVQITSTGTPNVQNTIDCSAQGKNLKVQKFEEF